MAFINVPLPNKGQNVSVPAELIDIRETPNAQNMDDDRGVIRKRLGTIARGSSLGERVMGYAQLIVGSNVYVVRFGTSKVQLLDQITNIWGDIQLTALTGTASDQISVCFPYISASKVMVYTNGIDAPRKYSGGAVDALLGGSPPTGKYACTLGSYLIFGNLSDGAAGLQNCDTGDPEEWITGNSRRFDLVDDGFDLTGLKTWGNFATAHKESAIYVGYVVSTSEVLRWDRKETGVGTVCDGTIQTLPTGEQIFLARSGLRTFNGISAPLLQSPIIDELREEMNPEHLGKSWSVIVEEEDEYHLGVAIGSQTTPDTVYKYNYRTGAIWKDTRSNTTAAGIYRRTNQITWAELVGSWSSQTWRWNDISFSSLAPTVIYGDTSGNTTEKSNSTSDNGTAIDAFYETKDFTAQDFFPETTYGTMLRFKGIQIWAKGDAMDVSYSTDSGSTWNIMDTNLALSTDYPTDDAPLFSYCDVVASQCRFRFRNNNADEAFSLKKYLPQADQRERRQ